MAAPLSSMPDLGSGLLLVAAGALASGINSVAGGGSLISFPVLTLALGIPPLPANATNAVALWPGSLAGALGFSNQIKRTAPYLRTLFLPTLFGSCLGAWLLGVTSQRVFDLLVPVLILLASLLLLFQGKIKAWALRGGHAISPPAGMAVQFFVALYGGYFGAGMGIMMLAAFALLMEGTIHELNAVKTWLGLVINFAASVLFVFQGLVLVGPAVALTIGSIIGGFAAARLSQRADPERLRIAIAVYGLAMALFFAYRAL